MYTDSACDIDCVSFDTLNQTIIRNNDSIQLSAKAFAALEYFCKNPGQLITKQALLDEIWQDRITVEAVIKNVISEIRKALNDNPKSPIYLMTVHRRGYRYIGADRLIILNQNKTTQNHDCSQQQNESVFVGRENQLSMITNSWMHALHGNFVDIVIKGDPGVGKSALVNSWLSRLSNNNEQQTLVIQTRASQSTHEIPYITLLDFIDQIHYSSYSSVALTLLATHCPDIHKNLLRCSTHNSQRKTIISEIDASQSGQLLIQFTNFLRSFTQSVPLIWTIDDAQYCDQNTKTILGHDRLRSSVKNLMILMTHCDWHTPGQADTPHQNNFNLYTDHNTQHIVVPFLERNELSDFVCKSLKNQSNNTDIANTLYELSGGHPLFMKGLIDYLLQNKSIEKIPTLLEHRMQEEICKLTTDYYRLLQAASVVVVDEFSAAAIASLMNISILQAEDYCEDIAKSTGWIKRSTSRTWPDGTVAQLYKFSHLIYRDYLYQTLPAAKKQTLHFQHAKRLEKAYNNKVKTIAKNLLYHYQQSACHQGIERYSKMVNEQVSTTIYKELKLQPLYHHLKHPLPQTIRAEQIQLSH